MPRLRVCQAGSCRYTIGLSRFGTATVKLEFIAPLSFCTFLVSARKVPQRSRVKGRYGQMRPLYNPPPHRHPAFKNVPIFERLHFTNLKVCSAEPAENRDIFSGRWPKAAGVGSGARMRFARNASPRTISLVTFLFGHKKVTLIDCPINCNLTFFAVWGTIPLS